MSRLIAVLLLLVVFLSVHAAGQMKFYNYYSAGTEYMQKGDFLRAIEEFKSAASLEFEDTPQKRIYGTRFMEYYPHRELGIAYYYIGELNNAMRELELSVAYDATKDAQEYLSLCKRGIRPDQTGSKDRQAAEDRKLREAKELAARQQEEDLARQKDEDAAREREARRKADERTRLESSRQTTLPVGALTYDPSLVTQVGSRLALAVMPFEGKALASDLTEPATDKMVAQMVGLRRFKVIERSALDRVMKEQKLQSSGLVDEQTAVKVGKVAGADAIVLGSITILGRSTKVNARVIDTETSETIVAHYETVEGSNIDDIERVVGNLAIAIYNELPLVEGYILSGDVDTYWIDIGSNKGIRKGSKCVAFREGEPLLHPKTGQVLAHRVTKLGEMIVVSVQEKVAEVRVIQKDQDIKVGDKIVVK